MYALLKETLADHGEVMAIMDSGEVVELHLGNTRFDEPQDGVFTVEGYDEAGKETRFYDGEKLESVRLHYDL